MPRGIYERKTYRNKPIRKLRNKRRPEQTTIVVGKPETGHANAPGNVQNLERFSTGAVRRATTPSRTDLIPTQFMLALGERYHYGATVRGYGERNWEAGIPYSNLIQHIQKHVSDLAALLIQPHLTKVDIEDEEGNTPRDQAAAAAWGLAAIIHFLHFGNPAEEA